MEKIIESFSEQETRALGEQLGREALPGQVYCLEGDLGTGKTVLAQGFAAGLGVSGPVASPTFTIMQVYEDGRLPFCHMDVYRLEDEEELEAIGGREMLDGDGVCLVEWGGIVRELLPEDCCYITVEKEPARGTEYRRITLRRKDTL